NSPSRRPSGRSCLLATQEWTGNHTLVSVVPSARNDGQRALRRISSLDKHLPSAEFLCLKCKPALSVTDSSVEPVYLVDRIFVWMIDLSQARTPPHLLETLLRAIVSGDRNNSRPVSPTDPSDGGSCPDPRSSCTRSGRVECSTIPT